MKKIILFFCLFFISGCTNEEKYPRIEYFYAKKEDVVFEKTYYGYIDRGLDVELSFGVSGKIDKIYKFEEETAKKGALLAVIDNEEYEFAINKAEIELEDAAIKSKRLKSYATRVEKLYKAGGISYNDYESAQTNLRSSENQIKISKDNLNIARKKEFFTKIYAPFDGQIIRVYKDEGNYVKEGENVFLYQGKGMAEARIFVPENDINSIETGSFITLKSSAVLDKKFKGKVKSTLKTDINEGSYRVTISILNEDERLIDGMNVSASFKNVIKNSIVIPNNSIYILNDEKYVFILDKISKKVEIRKIKTKEENGKIIIISGINENEPIVLNPNSRLLYAKKVIYD